MPHILFLHNDVEVVLDFKPTESIKKASSFCRDFVFLQQNKPIFIQIKGILGSTCCCLCIAVYCPALVSRGTLL